MSIRWYCTVCMKSFADPVLAKEVEGDATKLLDYIDTDSIICSECATDRVCLSSSTYLNRESKSEIVSRETMGGD